MAANRSCRTSRVSGPADRAGIMTGPGSWFRGELSGLGVNMVPRLAVAFSQHLEVPRRHLAVFTLELMQPCPCPASSFTLSGQGKGI